eukprot:3225916-Alexandrium_andersonii.AAC.1
MFQNEHRKGSALRENMNNLTTYEQKRKYRLERAKARLAEIQKSKKHVKSWRNIDKNKGMYVCFATLVESQGFLVDADGAQR